MESLYVIEPGAYLRREGAAIKICKGKTVIENIPADGLKKLTLVGYVSLTGGVMDFLINKKVETVFLTPTGRFRARLGIDEHKHVALRRAQYIRLSEKEYAAETSAVIVEGKIENMARFLLIRARLNKSDKNNVLRTAAARIRSIKNLCGEDHSDISRIRGFEGAATRIYYSVFNDLIINQNFRFNGRNRRPPRDPVNALLSFVYTLLTNEVLSAVKAAGLDPYMGSLHSMEYGRPSLACDLVEEYRSFLGDRMVLTILNKKMITPDDFVYRKKPPANFIDERDIKASRPVEMKPAIMKTFISAYESMMARKIHYPRKDIKTSYRMLLHHQAACFANHLESDNDRYQPFIWES